MKCKFARFQNFDDSLWVYIPIVRYLCDSVSTVDSLKCQPIRTYAISFFKGDTHIRELWFVEDKPTLAYHRNRVMSIWYYDLTGQRYYYNQQGRLVSSKKLYNGLKKQFTRLSDADSSDIGEIELPEVEITAPRPRGGYWGNLFSPWGNLPYIDSDGGGNIGDIGSDVSGGTSGGGNGKNEKKPERPVEDCVDTLMQRSKKQVRLAYEKIGNTYKFSVGTENLYSFSYFKDSVASNRKVEWTTVLRDFSFYGDNRGCGISEIRTDNQPYRCGVKIGESDQAAIAIIHNHPNGSGISAIDIMTLVQNAEGHPNLNTIMAWDDCTDTYYCATITNRNKAKEFYDKYKSCVNKETGYWDMVNTNDIKTFLMSEHNEESFARYGKKAYLNNIMVGILTYFDAGISLVKIENDKDAGGEIETFFTSYGAFKRENGKYINIKNCR